MRNKCIILFTLVIFLFTGLNAHLYASQDNFYGTWTCKFSDDDYTIILTVTISATRMTWEFEELFEGYEVESDKLTLDIIRWAEVINTDSDTRSAYPNGFTVEIIDDEDYSTEEIEMFISRDKRQITIPLFNDELGDILIFRKQ